jgi:hypothetical protein
VYPFLHLLLNQQVLQVQSQEARLQPLLHQDHRPFQTRLQDPCLQVYLSQLQVACQQRTLQLVLYRFLVLRQNHKQGVYLIPVQAVRQGLLLLQARRPFQIR